MPRAAIAVHDDGRLDELWESAGGRGRSLIMVNQALDEVRVEEGDQSPPLKQRRCTSLSGGPVRLTMCLQLLLLVVLSFVSFRTAHSCEMVVVSVHCQRAQ